MKTLEDVESLEKLIGQLQGAHTELIVLAKKDPDKTLNKFKLNLINSVLKSANTVLGTEYKPFDSFEEFEGEDLPTSSDVTMVLFQYMQEAERYRSDNVMKEEFGGWYYIVDGKKSAVLSGPPSKVGKK